MGLKGRFIDESPHITVGDVLTRSMQGDWRQGCGDGRESLTIAGNPVLVAHPARTSCAAVPHAVSALGVLSSNRRTAVFGDNPSCRTR